MGYRPIRQVLLAMTSLGLAVNLVFAGSDRVIVNAIAMSPKQIHEVESRLGGHLVPGRYWYDAISGLWGYEGGPTVGFVLAGLRVGGPLQAQASNGDTGVFFNGRQLHSREVMYLATLGPVLPGRFWLDALGNVGYEGRPAFANLPALHALRYGANDSVTPGGASIASGSGCIVIDAPSSRGIGRWGASNC